MAGNRLRVPNIEALPEHMREQARARLVSFSNPPTEGKNWVRETFLNPKPANTESPPPPDAEQAWIEAACWPKTQGRADPEHKEQVTFIQELRALAISDPRYTLAVKRTYAVPNGRNLNRRQRGRLKAEGGRRGIPDLKTDLPVGPWHGLEIEMKSSTGDASVEQKEWIADSARLGYISVVCRSWQQALIVWKAYVEPSL